MMTILDVSTQEPLGTCLEMIATAPEPALAAPTGEPEAAAPPRESRLAAAASYVGYLPFIATFVSFPFAYSGYPAAWPAWRILVWVASVLLGAVVPTMILALLAHRKLRRNPGLKGRLYVWFAYAFSFAATLMHVIALARKAFGKH